MKAHIIIIGDEILLGRVIDTNTGTISRALEPQGISIENVVTVHDDARAIARAVEQATATAPIVLTTGGLGPTKDDITKHTLCRIFGGKLQRDDAVLAHIRNIFAAKGLDMNTLTEEQAMVPDVCQIIENPTGTAPVMCFDTPYPGVLISLPGVPSEVVASMPGVVDVLRQKFSPGIFFCHRHAVVTGISESLLAQKLNAFEESLPSCLHLAYLPYSPIIRLRLDGSGTDKTELAQAIDKAHRQLLAEVSDFLIAEDDISTARILLNNLERLSYTVSTAESCTGGGIAQAITAEAGASVTFMGSVVAYSNEAKNTILDVSAQTLDTYGAVSEQTICQMLAGARKIFGADCAIATSGIAGPGGGTPDKPVGTVWIGAQTPNRIATECLHLRGSRTAITQRATALAMLKLISLLRTAK